MKRAMGLDVGSKTIGVAVSDLMGWTAQGVETVKWTEPDYPEAFKRLDVMDRAIADGGRELLEEVVRLDKGCLGKPVLDHHLLDVLPRHRLEGLCREELITDLLLALLEGGVTTFGDRMPCRIGRRTRPGNHRSRACGLGQPPEFNRRTSGEGPARPEALLAPTTTSIHATQRRRIPARVTF